MLTTLLAVTAFHLLALAGVLFLARADRLLVDEAGRPALAPAWRQQVIPRAARERTRR